MVVANPAANASVDRLIVVRTIGAADIRDALAKGWADFQAMPTFALFLAILYPIIGLILFSLVFKSNLLQLAFPLTAGFLGPRTSRSACGDGWLDYNPVNVLGVRCFETASISGQFRHVRLSGGRRASMRGRRHVPRKEPGPLLCI